MLEIQTLDGITTIRMAHGKASALDLELCAALTAAFTEAAKSARAIVLTGTGRIFSAGVDLPRLLREGERYTSDFMAAMDRCFGTLFECERPVVAAINGHAIAGGCIFAAVCDWRVMVDANATIGIPELAVGVPFPVTPLEIVRSACGDALTQRLALGCENLAPQEALRTGLIHALAPADKLAEAALAQAQRLAQVPPRAFALVKKQLRAPALERMRALRLHDEEVARQWHTKEVRAAITAYVEKTLKK
ncbi:Short-chain-enoyl-CoA hydratase [Planctomycetaceae bacterium]|nr:Short-chain-enoyl-CoA hydratase [Planctomycetaceae bacterium]